MLGLLGWQDFDNTVLKLCKLRPRPDIGEPILELCELHRGQLRIERELSVLELPCGYDVYEPVLKLLELRRWPVLGRW